MREDLCGRVQLAVCRHEEDHGQTQQFTRFKVGRGFVHEGAEADIDLLRREHGLDFLLAAMGQGEVKSLFSAAHAHQQFRQVIALYDFYRGNAQSLFASATQAVFHFGEAIKERGNKIVKGLAFASELKRSALIKRDAEGVLELQNLRADGRLLDAVGHGPCGGADPAVPGDVVEEFKVMDVHPMTSSLYVKSMGAPWIINYSGQRVRGY